MAAVRFDNNDMGSLLITGTSDELATVIALVKSMNSNDAINVLVNSMNSNDAIKKAFGNEEDNEEHDAVNKPLHYCSGKIETIDKIEAVIDGLPAKKAASLANVLKYFDRAGLKDDTKQDLDKANNYAHRLVHGKWRNEE